MSSVDWNVLTMRIESMECWLEYQPFPVIHFAGNALVNTPSVKTPLYNVCYFKQFPCFLFPVNLKN